MTPLAWLGLAGAATYVYKKKPQWLPSALRPKGHPQKTVALAQVTATSAAATPHAEAGLDPNMSSVQVAAANGLLSSSVDPNAAYAMASNYSELGFLKTSEALIAKAEALTEAKKHGAEDDELQAQMKLAAQTADWESRFGKKK